MEKELSCPWSSLKNSSFSDTKEGYLETGLNGYLIMPALPPRINPPVKYIIPIAAFAYWVKKEDLKKLQGEDTLGCLRLVANLCAVH